MDQKLFESIGESLRHIARVLAIQQQILVTLLERIPPRAHSATLILQPNVFRRFSHPTGAWLDIAFATGEPSMDLTAHLNDGGCQALFKEWSKPGGTGVQVPPVGPVNYSSSDSTVATVDQNGQVAYLTKGSVVITATDAGNSQSASANLTIVDDVAQSSTLDLVPNQ